MVTILMYILGILILWFLNPVYFLVFTGVEEYNGMGYVIMIKIAIMQANFSYSYPSKRRDADCEIPTWRIGDVHVGCRLPGYE